MTPDIIETRQEEIVLEDNCILGINAYIHIKWSAVQPASNDDLKDTPDAYIGICTDIYKTAPADYTAYAWYLYKGPKGDKGDQGLQGPKGEQGIQGIQGLKGDTGAQGEKGDQGDQGLQGDRGLQGEQGLQGIKGDTGSKGDKGDKGDSGLPGTDGANGADGYTPVKGVDYFDGADGLSAYEIAVAGGFEGAQAEWLLSLAGANGADGYTPVKGVDYFDGADGEDGYTPVKDVDYFDGEDGIDGNSYTWRADTWEATAEYEVGDVIAYEGSSYGCKAHNIGDDTNRPGVGLYWTSYWFLMAGGGTNGIDGQDGAPGADGETAFAAAQAGGYTGTASDFYSDLAAMEGLAAELAAL